MTDTTEDLTQLNTAIVRVSKEVLISLLWKICETNPSARDFAKGHLFVHENEVPQPMPATTTGPKRMRTRYANCINCKEEFDVSENTKKSCSYHPDLAMPDYDMWPDHDENCHGPIDTEENQRNYPGSFIYQCCERYGDEDPCVTDWHRERKYDYETAKRQRF